MTIQQTFCFYESDGGDGAKDAASSSSTLAVAPVAPSTSAVPSTAVPSSRAAASATLSPPDVPRPPKPIPAPKAALSPSLPPSPSQPASSGRPERHDSTGSSGSTGSGSEKVSADSETERSAVLRQLRAKVGDVRSRSTATADYVSTGCSALDDLLPRRGLRAGTITEWLAETSAGGAASVSLAVTANQWLRIFDQGRGTETASDALMKSEPASMKSGPLKKSGPLVVVDPEGTFYPPAAAALGVPAERIVWCRPRSRADTVWAIDQALRCRSVAAVWGTVGAWLDDRDARRLQLAAEAGATSGMILRPPAVRGRPTFAETRLHVGLGSSLRGQCGGGPWSMKVTLDRCRGGNPGNSAWVTINHRGQLQSIANRGQASRPIEVDHHETAARHLASQLADPTLAKSSARVRRRRA